MKTNISEILTHLGPLTQVADVPPHHALIEYRAGNIYRTEIVDAVCATVTVGTTGPRGGDAGHGSRTVCEIDFQDGQPGLRLLTAGDAELRVLIDALEFAASVLRAQSA